jgi:hypothetical protein
VYGIDVVVAVVELSGSNFVTALALLASFPTMPPAMERQKPQPILFVDVQKSNEKNVKTQIRSHLMHEHVRQKRIQQNHYLKSVVLPQRRVSEPQIPPRGREVKTGFVSQLRRSVTTIPKVRRSSTEKAVQDAVSRHLECDDLESNAVIQLPNPVTSVSSLRRDSFSSYPVALDPDSHQLVDLWLTNFPQMTQLNLSPSIELIFAPTLKVFFPLAMSSPAAFETTVLHFAALHRARLRGIQNDKHVMHHRMKSLALTQDMLEQTINGDRLINEGDLVAVLSLGTAEDRFGDELAACIHLQGARQLIRRSREQGRLPMNHKIDLLFNWYNINTPTPTHYEAKTNPRVFAELSSDFENLLIMLDNFHTLALSHHSEDPQSMTPRLLSPYRLDPALCRILASPPPTSPGYNSFSFQMCRFLTLLHIHMALFFSRESPVQSENYLKHLSLRIIALDLEFRPNPVFLLVWALLSDEVLHDSLRGWLVGRISVVFKLLCFETRHRVSDYLHALLALEDDAEGHLVVPDLDRVVLEREVLGVEVDLLAERMNGV